MKREDIDTLKKQYNSFLKRFENGVKYLELPERTEDEIDKWLPELERIAKEISKVFCELRKNNVNVKANEFLEI